jgi:hypothetical protein
VSAVIAAVESFFGLSEVYLVDGSQLLFDESGWTVQQFQDGQILRVRAKGR